MQYRLANCFLLLLVLLLGVNIIHSWANLSQRGEIIKQTQENLEKAKEDNEDFKRQLAKVESQEFIEKEIRNRLNLVKEGEVIIILPSISPISSPTPTPVDTSANWQKWVKIFL